jgi:uncharacterized membrane protein YphA (DoxX/SURF4 family)
MLASIFVVGPINTLRNSSGAAAKAEPVTDPLVRLAQRAGLPIAQDPEKLVKINAGVQLAAGLCLATGRFPRLAAAVLATTLVPTTLAGHDFWNESDPAARRQQQVQLAKNLSLLGGLIIAAGDTDGRPGVAWLAKHTVGDARRELGHRTSTAKLEGKVAALEAGLGATSLGAAAIGAGQQAKEAIKGAAHQAASSDATQRLAERATELAAELAATAKTKAPVVAERATGLATDLAATTKKTAPVVAERATELASDLAATTKKKAPIVAAATREQIATLAETAREQAKPVVAELGKQARTTGAELKKQARANAKDLRKQAAASTKDVRKQARKSGKKAAKDARKSYVKKQKELAKAARKQLGQAKATLA